MLLKSKIFTLIMALTVPQKLKLSPDKDNWQMIDFTIVNPTSSPVTFNLFDVNSQVPIPEQPNVLPPTSASGTISVGNAPTAAAYCSSNNCIYVVNSGSNSVTVISSNTNTVVATISSGFNTPQSLAYCPTNNSMYVTNNGSATVSVINCNTNAVSTISMGFTNTFEIAYNSINNSMYVATVSSIKVIDCSTNSVSILTLLGFIPAGVAFNPYNNNIYVVDFAANLVYPIDCNTNTIGSSIATGSSPYYLSYSQTSNKLYVANYSSNNITVIDAASNAVLSTIAVGTNPNSIGWNSYNDLMYIGNYTDNTLSIISCSNDTVLYTITGVDSPQGNIGFGVQGNSIYVSDLLTNNVTVVTPIRNAYITSSSIGYYQFLRDLSVNPKVVRQAIMIAPNSQMKVNLDFVYTNYTGQSFSTQRYPNLSITQHMPQTTIAELNFKTKGKDLEFILDEHNYISQYTVLPNTTVVVLLYYKELIRSDMLDLFGETPLLSCRNVFVQNCSDENESKKESELPNFGENVITIDEIIALQEEKEKLNNKKP